MRLQAASPKKAQGACAGVGQEQGGDPTAWMAGRATCLRARAGKPVAMEVSRPDLDPGGGLTLTRKDKGKHREPWAPKPSVSRPLKSAFP